MTCLQLLQVKQSLCQMVPLYSTFWSPAEGSNRIAPLTGSAGGCIHSAPQPLPPPEVRGCRPCSQWPPSTYPCVLLAVMPTQGSITGKGSWQYHLGWGTWIPTPPPPPLQWLSISLGGLPNPKMPEEEACISHLLHPKEKALHTFHFILLPQAVLASVL